MVNNVQTFIVDPQCRLMISYKTLICNKIFTSDSYKSQKNKGRFCEVKIDGVKWVYVDSLTRVSRDKVIDRFSIQNDNDVIKAIGKDNNPQYIIIVKQLDNVNDIKITTEPTASVGRKQDSTRVGKWLKQAKLQAAKLFKHSK